jgi:hypothetical protein
VILRSRARGVGEKKATLFIVAQFVLMINFWQADAAQRSFNNESMPPIDMSKNAFLLGLDADKADCHFARFAEAPSVMERASFERRVSLKDGVILEPIKLNCLSEYFPKNQIHYWSSRGDPVAMYLELYDRYPTFRLACANYSIVRDKLQEIFDKKSGIKTKYGQLSRVPEAFYVSRRLTAVCRNIDSELTVDNLTRHGISPFIGLETAGE